MTKQPETQQKQDDISGMTAEQFMAALADKDAIIERAAALKDAEFERHTARVNAGVKRLLDERDIYIRQLEAFLKLTTLRKFASSTEALPGQNGLFDEAELEAAFEDAGAELPEQEPAKPRSKTRQRGFAPSLPRVRIEHSLPDDVRAQAIRCFFTKVKEELDFVPATLRVLEHWQEQAVLHEQGAERMVAAARPVHPLGKCSASVALLVYIIVSKYADGLPLYRLNGLIKRYGHDVDRTVMANWIIRLGPVFQPLLNLMREVQNGSPYLNVDETRIQVLKEDGKTAQSDKWMWVARGGPPGQPSVLFEYDPSRAGAVPERLFDGFNGVLQCDGYAGYAKVCALRNLPRAGCWDHVRRKFVEAVKIAGVKHGQKKVPVAVIAVEKIRKLYAVERRIKDESDDEKRRLRQAVSLPLLEELHAWLRARAGTVMRGSKTEQAISYALNQWDTLTVYCDYGYVNISNAAAENAIRPFAVGRRAWLFADTSRGAQASATCYSLIETAKANNLEPSAYIGYVLSRIADATTVEQIEALLPWNVDRDQLQSGSR